MNKNELKNQAEMHEEIVYWLEANYWISKDIQIFLKSLLDKEGK